MTELARAFCNSVNNTNMLTVLSQVQTKSREQQNERLATNVLKLQTTHFCQILKVHSNIKKLAMD